MLRKISVITKSTNKYRSDKFENLNINACDNAFFLCLNRNPHMSQDEISKRVVINKSNTARIIARLEEDGFIERVQAATDKRRMEVSLTDKGTNLIPEIENINNNFEKYLTETLSEEELNTFNNLLHKVYIQAVKYVKQDWGDEDEPSV